MVVFGKNTAAKLDSAAKARAVANEHATYGAGKHEADLNARSYEAEIYEWKFEREEEADAREEEEADFKLSRRIAFISRHTSQRTT